MAAHSSRSAALTATPPSDDLRKLQADAISACHFGDRMCWRDLESNGPALASSHALNLRADFWSCCSIPQPTGTAHCPVPNFTSDYNFTRAKIAQGTYAQEPQCEPRRAAHGCSFSTQSTQGRLEGSALDPGKSQAASAKAKAQMLDHA